MTAIQGQFDSQQFSNGYQLVNGVAMHAKNPDNFHVPPDVIKRHTPVSMLNSESIRRGSRSMKTHQRSATALRAMAR